MQLIGKALTASIALVSAATALGFWFGPSGTGRVFFFVLAPGLYAVHDMSLLSHDIGPLLLGLLVDILGYFAIFLVIGWLRARFARR